MAKIKALGPIVDATACIRNSTSVGMTIVLVVLMALPIAMMSVGVQHLSECPVAPNVPIYLLVGGCFGLLKLLSKLWRQVRARRAQHLDEFYHTAELGRVSSDPIVLSKTSRWSEAALSVFLLVWFGVGNYWVFSVWRPNFVQLLHEPSNWCDQTVYMFAAIQIFICYGVMGLIIILSIVLAVCQQWNGDNA